MRMRSNCCSLASTLKAVGPVAAPRHLEQPGVVLLQEQLHQVRKVGIVLDQQDMCRCRFSHVVAR